MWQWDVHTVYGMLRPRPDSLITENSVLVRHGSLTFFSPNTMTHKPRYFFLFDHAFLVTKQRKHNKFQLKVYVTLRPELQVITDDRDNQFRINATIKGKSYPLIMFANSRSQKEAWVNDIIIAISRLGERNYGLESHALSQDMYKSGVASSEEEDSPRPTSPSAYNNKKSTPKNSARDYDLGWETDAPSRRSSSSRGGVTSPHHSHAHESPRYSSQLSDEESPRHSPRDASSARRGSKRETVKVERKVERQEILEITDPARGKTTRSRRTRKVYYDSDEEPHYYTDSEDESDSDADSSSSNSSNGSGGGGGTGGRPASYDGRTQDRGSTGEKERGSARRTSVSDKDVTRPGSNRKAPSKKRITDVDGGDGSGVLPSPPVASSAQRDRRKSSRLSRVPAEAQSHAAPTQQKDPYGAQGLAYSLETLSLGTPQVQQPIFYSQQDQRPVVQQQPHQQHHHHHHQQQQAPQHAQPQGSAAPARPALGKKVMDLDGLNTADFNKIAARGFKVNKASKDTQKAQQPTQQPQQHHHVQTVPQQQHLPQGMSQQQLPPQQPLQQQATVTPQQPLMDPMMGMQQSALQPQMYQHLLMQQQQQYLQHMQQLQQQQLQQQQLQQQAKLGQPTSQPTTTTLPTTTTVPTATLQTTTLPSLQQQQLQQQQLQQQQLQQLQMQQLQQLQQLQQKQPSASTLAPTQTPPTSLQFSATSPQGQQGVIYVDPLTYLQYQQQQQLLQLQQQQLLQQQQQQQLLQQQQLQQQFQYPTAGGLPLYMQTTTTPAHK